MVAAHTLDLAKAKRADPALLNEPPGCQDLLHSAESASQYDFSVSLCLCGSLIL